MIGAIIFAILWGISQIWVNSITIFLQGILVVVLFLGIAEEVGSLEKENITIKLRLKPL